MTKKPTKKKKPIKKPKVMTVEVEPVAVSGSPEARVSALKSLVASSGWAILVGIMNDNINYLESAILDKVNPETGEDITDEQVEFLRIKRGLNIELRDTPKNYSKEIMADLSGDGEDDDDGDPFWKADDLRKEEERRRASTEYKNR